MWQGYLEARHEDFVADYNSFLYGKQVTTCLHGHCCTGLFFKRWMERKSDQGLA